MEGGVGSREQPWGMGGWGGQQLLLTRLQTPGCRGEGLGMMLEGSGFSAGASCDPI